MPYVTHCLVHCMQCQCIASNSWKLVPTPNATHHSLMPRLSTALPANTSTYQWKQDCIFSFLTSSMIALETGKRYALITKILWFLLVLHTWRGWYKDNLHLKDVCSSNQSSGMPWCHTKMWAVFRVGTNFTSLQLLTWPTYWTQSNAWHHLCYMPSLGVTQCQNFWRKM